MLPNQAEELDPRVRRTRQSIVQAFMKLINQKGFQAISVQDITEQAGINRATFYAHFPDKYALLRGIPLRRTVGARHIYQGSEHRKWLD